MKHDVSSNGMVHIDRHQTRRPRVLLGAFTCGPELGSEPGIGWNRAVELARYCDVWVLADAYDWEWRINKYLERHGPIPHLNFLFVPRRRWEVAAEFKPLLSYVAYRRWLRRAYCVAERAHSQVRFDIAHQLTYASFREPGYLHQLGIPFVWGPVGGAQNYPWRFLSGAGFVGACSEATRSLLNRLQMYGARRVRVAAKTAATVLASNRELQQQFREILKVDSQVLCDVGSFEHDETFSAPRTPDGRIRILWVGIFTARKALELLLEALAKLPANVQYDLRVVGQGRRRREWKRFAERRGVAANVQWIGHVSHDEAREHFRWADVLAFTSLRDTTGTVVLEAMSAGKPVICLDHQGAGDVVTSDCGIKIPVTTRRKVAQHLADAITALHKDPEYCQALGRRARRRVERYRWSSQARQIVEEYNSILKSVGSDARCDLDSPAGVDRGSQVAPPLDGAESSDSPVVANLSCE